MLLLAGGTSAPGVRAAKSHTGALVSEAVAIEAACRAAGILQVSTPRELADLAQLALATSRPRGRRVAIVTDGGGSAVVAADLATGAGLELPQLSPALAGSLAEVLPDTATTTNPVDFAGAGEQDLSSYERVPRLLLESGEVDALLLTGYLGGYSATSEELREPETEAARGLARAAAEAGTAGDRPDDVLAGVARPGAARGRRARLPRDRRGDRLHRAGRGPARAVGRPRAASGGRAVARLRVPGVARAARPGRRRLPRGAAGVERGGGRRGRGRARLPGRAQGARASCTSPTRAASRSGSRTTRRSRLRSPG